MRDLSYRVYDKERKEYSDKAFSLDQCGILYVQDEDGYWEEASDRYIIELSTGLEDKNGKVICEGNIVSEEFEYDGEKVKTIWQVRWCDDECAFELHYVSGFEVDDCSLVTDDEENYEIIGNIHENPELVKEKE